LADDATTSASLYFMALKPDRSDEEVIAAVRRGDVGELRRIVGSDASKATARDPSGVSALLLAVYENHDDAVRLLLEHRRDVDVFEAAAIGLTDAVQQILRQDQHAVHGWSIDGFAPLHLAAHFNRADTIQALLRAGADVGAVSHNSLAVMPLHSAVAGRARESARLLLEAGAAPNAPQAGGWFAVLSAAQHGDEELIRLLQEFGADLSVRDRSGRTVAAVATEAGHYELAQWIARECGLKSTP
jgi:uncharacterized protein